MNKYEKISTFLSSLALIIAIASPFITYHWLDPQLQAFQHRAKLQVTMVESGSGVSGDYSNPDYTILVIDGSHEIKIVNTGDLPARDVLISAQYLEAREASIAPTVSPPSPIESVSKDTTQLITLKRPIAPHDTVQVQFSSSPKVIWVSNEFGETSTITTGKTAIRVDEKTNIQTILEAIPPTPSPTPKKNVIQR